VVDEGSLLVDGDTADPRDTVAMLAPRRRSFITLNFTECGGLGNMVFYIFYFFEIFDFRSKMRQIKIDPIFFDPK
jgi:hypothetical protein